VVVDVTKQLARLENALTVVAVTRLDTDALAVQHDVAPPQPIQTRRAVALNLVSRVVLCRLRRKAVELDDGTAILDFDASQRPVVTRKLRAVEHAMNISEKHVELLAVELEVKLLGACGVVALLHAVAVQRVVLAGIDRREETVVAQL